MLICRSVRRTSAGLCRTIRTECPNAQSLLRSAATFSISSVASIIPLYIRTNLCFQTSHFASFPPARCLLHKQNEVCSSGTKNIIHVVRRAVKVDYYFKYILPVSASSTSAYRTESETVRSMSSLEILDETIITC